MEYLNEGKKYTKEDLEYLENNWGAISIEVMARTLKRKESAIIMKCARMKLGSRIEIGRFLVLSHVANLLNCDRKVVCKHIERGLKSRRREIGKRTCITFKVEDLFQWMIENPSLWSATKIDIKEIVALGIDKEYILKKLAEDKNKLKRTTLSEKDIQVIKNKYKNYETYEDIAIYLNKEYNTIRWKIHTLIKAGELKRNVDNNRLVRKTKRDNYGWTKQQDKVLMDEFLKGTRLKDIALIVDKSLSAVKSRNQVLTKRRMMGLSI